MLRRFAFAHPVRLLLAILTLTVTTAVYAACGSETAPTAAPANNTPAATPAPTATPTPASAPTATPMPTDTPAPAATATPYPTHTPYPTPTAYPTFTPYPTLTPVPTPTPTPRPTATPRPTPTPRPTATPRPTPTPAPLAQYQGVQKALAALTVYIETPTGTGSGFIYNRNAGKDTNISDYVIVTNQHVVKNYSNVEICWAVLQKCVTGKVVAKSENLDIAVIEHSLFNDHIKSSQWFWRTVSGKLKGWGGNWSSGDVVYASGYPGGNKARGGNIVSDPVVSEGITTRDRLTPYRGGSYIEHGADVEPGSSGGPLMNNAGYIIGVNVGVNPEAERLEIAIPMGYVLNWLDTGEEPGASGRPKLVPTATPSPTLTPRPTPTPRPTATPTPTPIPPVGTRENPIPFNSAVSYPNWSVSVLSFNRNANDAIAAESQFNDPPDPGHVYVLVRVQGTYTGTGFGSMWIDLDFYAVGAANVLYEEVWRGSIPDELSDQPDVLSNGIVSGNVAFMVPSDEVNSLLLVIANGFLRYADTIGYFSLK